MDTDGGVTAKEAAEAHKLPSRLAAQIIERAKHMRLTAGTHLVEQELADAFRVSRTPVRMALRVLADMDLVESRPNRGFFLKHPAPRIGSLEGFVKPPPEGADEDPLYFRIAEDRLNGEVEQRCTEAELARRYGVSRPRLLRLLSRMAQEGWVARLPGHGWEFQPLLTSSQSYEQGYRYRMLIEPQALLEPGFHLSAAMIAHARSQQLAMLEGGIQHWSSSETFAANSVFHEIIVSGAGNPFLLEGLRRVNRLRRLLEYRMHQFRPRLVRECRDHLELLDMIERGDYPQAAAFLREHLDSARLAKTRLIAEGKARAS